MGILNVQKQKKILGKISVVVIKKDFPVLFLILCIKNFSFYYS